MREMDLKLDISENSERVLERRYLKKDVNGKIVETPQEMFMRVAQNIAKADMNYTKKSDIKRTEEEFYSIMSRLEFLPNSPTLMNAGKELQQLSACFVLPIRDSMEGIFDSLKSAALIHKCLTPDTLVSTDDGIKRLKDLKIGNSVLTDKSYFKIEGLYKNKSQIVYEVLTDRGFSLKGTSEHKLLVVHDNGDFIWREIGELKKGDWVVMQPCKRLRGGGDRLPAYKYEIRSPINSGCFKAQIIKFPKRLTPELAQLIGIYIGDGSNHRDGIRFSVGKDDVEMAQTVKRLSKAVFNKKVSISRMKNKGYEVSILSILIKKWFEFLGVTKPSSKKARIPEIIFKASEDVICAFLKGLFSTDGCIRENGHITLTTASKILSEELQSLMFYVGIPTHRRHEKSTDSYQVSVCTKDGFINFKQKIGFLLTRQNERLNGVCPKDIFKRGEIIPNQRILIKEWYENLGKVEEKREARLFFGDIINRISEPREISRQRVAVSLEKSKICPQFLKTLLDKDYFFVRVSKVSPLGVMDTYDITVSNRHTYLANGFITHNSGGGTGFSFSNLRPKNSVVKSTGGVASGPVSFMKVFDSATQAVKQGGTRRGANMGILRVDHPDILEFISCKENNKDITNFNISVMVTDDFMKKVEAGENYSFIDPHSRKKTGELNAKEVFERIVKMAYKNGEPGIIFYDKLNRDNPTPKTGVIEATNPCGEQPLLPYESCNLGSINLSRMVSDGNIDWKKFAKAVKGAVHFLDNVIDMNKFPLAIIREKTHENRKIGLGVMGFADMLIKLGIPYDSDEALKQGEEVMKFILESAEKASEELAEKRGVFPTFKKSIYCEKKRRGLRNATLTTIAPTGTLSIIANCSSGIEPIFAVSYIRNVMDNDELMEVHPLFLEIAKEKGFYSDELMKKIANEGSIQNFEEIPDDVKKLFRISLDISPEYHIKMQSAFQKYTNNAVSKTINFPNQATVDDVRSAYMLAYKNGCKGITIYRDKSREEQVLNIGKVGRDSVSAQEKEEAVDLKPKPRDIVTYGTTTKISTGCGNLYVTINNDEMGEPFEVFMQMGKAGGCAMSQLEAIGRLVSLALRSGVNVDSIIDQLKGIRCPSPSWEKGGGRIFSCSDAIARIVERRISEREVVEKEVEEDIKYLDSSLEAGDTSKSATASKAKTGSVVGVCPDCGAALRHVEGCQACAACGYSKC